MAISGIMEVEFMDDRIDLRIEGVDRVEFSQLLEQVGVKSGFSIEESKRLTGGSFIELMVELSKVDLNLMTLVLGFLLGKGAKLSTIISGRMEELHGPNEFAKILKYKNFNKIKNEKTKDNKKKIPTVKSKASSSRN